MNFAASTIAFAFGLIVGSFFNVVIHRVPRGKSIVSPGSRCPACGHAIRWHENVPLLSFVLLRARCAGCGAKISWRYPAIEFLTALLAVVLWQTLLAPVVFGAQGPTAAIQAALCAASLLVLVPVAAIDLVHYIIPDGITLGGLAIGLASSLLPGGITPLESVLGMAAGGGFLLLTGLFGEWVMKREDAMGGGDIKLMAFLGAVWGPRVALLGIVGGSLTGAAAGLALLAARSLRKDHRIPFGPFLALGVWIAALAGDRIMAAYAAMIDRIVLLLL